MLAFALTPIPDEMLYSIVARHGALLGHQDATRLSALLFGHFSDFAPVDQPWRLDHAARMLRFTTGRELLANHTAHFHDTAFTTAARREASEAWALRGETRLRGTSGIMAMALRPRAMLSFCDRCLTSCRGEDVYPWLRAHQLPGVFVCHLHGDALRVTSVARTGRRGANGYAALTRDVVRTAALPPRIPRAKQHVLLRYAHIAASLLEPIAWPEIQSLQDRLRIMLSDFRWERAASLIAMRRLVPAMMCHPNVAPLLEAMGVALPEGAWATALNGLLYRAGSGKHPLLVAMLLETLGAAHSDLLATPSPAPAAQTLVAPSDRDTVETPGFIELCANPGCTEMRREAVAAFASCAARKVATCSKCGFVIRAASKSGQRPVIVRTCPSWDAIVAETLADPAISVREAGRRFGASNTTLMRAARRGGTWRPEWKDRPKLREKAQIRPTQLRNRHRIAWLAHATGVDAGTPIKRTARRTFNAYRWLIRHDRKWIDTNRHPMCLPIRSCDVETPYVYVTASKPGKQGRAAIERWGATDSLVHEPRSATNSDWVLPRAGATATVEPIEAHPDSAGTK